MKKSILVSIIIPIYNVEKYLAKCIDSILNQTYQNIEIILIDDGSTDDSGRICDELAIKDNRIKVYHKKNGGVSSARNFGIEKASGDFIMFVDSDDLISLDYVEKFIDNSNLNTKKSFLCIDFKKKFKEKKYSLDQYICLLLKDMGQMSVCGCLFDKKKINNLRFDTNTSLMEDAIFLFTYLINNNFENVIIVKNCSYIYTENFSSLTKRKYDVLIKLKEYNYSLDKIYNIVNDSTFNNFDIKNAIFNKKIKIFEQTLSFIDNYSDYDKVFNCLEIRNIIFESNKYKIEGIRNKVFFSLMKRKNTYLLYLYYKVRRIYVSIKKRIE